MSKDNKEKRALKKEIGRRFKRFRESIKKPQYELAAELNLDQTSISAIENGNAFPKISYLNYLTAHYHLNLNWLSNDSGEMILHGGERAKASLLYRLFSPIDENDGRFAEYVELIKSMRHPDVEQIIFGKKAELKALLKDRLKPYLEEP